MKQIKAFTPPCARTHNSLALTWEKCPGAACYQILLNDKPQAVVACTDATVEHLLPDTVYACQVTALAADGSALASSDVLRLRTKPQGNVFDITAYGAVGDGKTLNTQAIQTAIDACTPHGIVLVPQGVFLTGALFLKSDMTLLVEQRGRLLGSTEPAHYPVLPYLWEGRMHPCYASLLNTPAAPHRHKNITIAGRGVIDANGTALFRAELDEAAAKRGRALYLANADGVYLKDITVRQSPSWCVHLALCTDVCLNGVSIHTKQDEYGNPYHDIFNGDGVDPESCKNVFIFHSTIESQDDCIALKSGRDEEGRGRAVACEDIRITNCVFKSGFGIAVGSEMSGGVRRVFVQDCVFQNAYSIGSIKAPRPRGGVVEQITFEDCRISNYGEHTDTCWFRGAIYIDQYYFLDTFDPDETHPVDEGTSQIRDITFRNLVLDTATGNAIFLAGLPESPLENIVLENVTALGKTGMKAYHVQGLVLQHTTVRAREGDAYFFHHVRQSAKG